MPRAIHEPALAAFQLGAKSQELRFRIEDAWWEPEGVEPLGLNRLGAEIETTQTIIERLDRNRAGSNKRAAEELSELLADFWTQFAADYRGQERHERIAAIRDAGPEACESVFHYQREHSPLKSPAWTRVEEKLSALSAALESTPRECFEFAQYLHAELCPVSSRLLVDSQEIGRRSVELADQINDRLQHLQIALPWLSQIEQFTSPLLNDSSIHWEVCRVACAVEEGLRNPSLAPSYLGLILDEDQGEARRGGKTVTIPMGLQWRLLRILVQARGNFSSRSSLEEAWDQAGLADPSDEALWQALSALRKNLEKVRLKLPAKRQIGWRLLDIKDAED